jgi:hypothetical protein
MTRLFTVLAWINGLALAASFAVGWASKFRGSLHHADTDPTYLVHFTFGLGAALLTLLIHCLIFTYFLGTGRWVKEVTLAYDLPDRPWHKATRELKRRTFPPALAAMLVTIATGAAGAGVQLQDWSWYVHFGAALAALLVNLWAFRVEVRALSENAAVMDGVLAEVDRIRAERGLPSNAEALAREGS